MLQHIDIYLNDSAADGIQVLAPATGFIEENEGVSFVNGGAALHSDVLLHIRHVPALLRNVTRKSGCLGRIEHYASEGSAGCAVVAVEPVNKC
jgi:hypothetical protein